MSSRRTEVLQRIYDRVDIKDCGYETPCHVWTGPDSGNGRGGGYGRFSLSGQTVSTHLVVFTHFFGYIPGKKQIDHKCRNRRCCNPDHLEMVSARENCKRKIREDKIT